MSTRPQPLPRSHFGHFETIATRWMDNDVYGHVNNVVHYSLFDTAVNRYLIQAGALDIHAGAVIGLVVRTQCDYFESIAFPQTVHAGLRVLRQGRSSVEYEIGLFADAAPLAAAVGHFVHVYVARDSRRPVPLPEVLRAALQALTLPAPPTPSTLQA
ncbi:Acyl-CoA thioester hydrolase [Rubrivivax sp. A210]|uniref:acyl-CoA thioesterase n=1 Tax=Rubrivivax sp. A210 TaxID=2772301 RepID=UPI00191B4D81|nr:thioesterase family protein [Rubrivivax sp. A210]CAD5366472.1 Acyl-CoA thioester hydrolase [Rubrivivax sp. A210]